MDPGIPAGRHGPGFTLTELTVVLLVTATLTLAAVPGMADLVARQRLAVASQGLVRALHQARQLAVTGRQPVQLCPVQDDGQCGTGTDWSRGWRIESGTVSAQLLATDRLPRRVTVATTSGRALVRFQADGRSTGSNVTFRLCSGGRWQRSLVLNNAGRVRMTIPERTSCS